jgi:hypothetical protein
MKGWRGSKRWNRREMSIRKWRRIERQEEVEGEQDSERGTQEEVDGSEKYRNMRTGRKKRMRT